MIRNGAQLFFFSFSLLQTHGAYITMAHTIEMLLIQNIQIEANKRVIVSQMNGNFRIRIQLNAKYRQNRTAKFF